MQRAPDAPAASIPLVAVPLSIGRRLWRAAGSGLGLALTLSAAPRGLPAYEDIASYSSFGPTTDGRVKPDLVAPGHVTSAKTDKALGGSPDACATVAFEGTSMATPVVAGSLALARQYFLDGFYPNGAAGSGARHEPSGVLLKALALAGASNMLGNTEAGLPLEPAPSFRQGFGRLNLTRALPLGGGGGGGGGLPDGWRLQVVDLASLEEGEAHTYCLRARGGAPLVAMLTWCGLTTTYSLLLVVVVFCFVLRGRRHFSPTNKSAPQHTPNHFN
jgi:hypothetical protein